jgi:hypothetical protein
MKFPFATIISLLLPALCSAATLHHEFGTIIEDGGVVSHTFSLAPGKTALSVINAFPGCPCVKADYPKRPVKAGEPLNVTVTYNPENQQGHFTRSVYLRLTGERRDTLVITGTVKRVRPKLSDEFPNEFGLGLCLKMTSIDFGTMRPGEVKTLTIPMANSYQASMSLDLQPAGADSTMIAVPYGLKLRACTRSEFKVTLALPKDAKPGKPDVSLQPVINGCLVDRIPLKVRIK